MSSITLDRDLAPHIPTVGDVLHIPRLLTYRPSDSGCYFVTQSILTGYDDDGLHLALGLVTADHDPIRTPQDITLTITHEKEWVYHQTLTVTGRYQSHELVTISKVGVDLDGCQKIYPLNG